MESLPENDPAGGCALKEIKGLSFGLDSPFIFILFQIFVDRLDLLDRQRHFVFQLFDLSLHLFH